MDGQMETPRRRLVRATETAINHYMQENVEQHLPLISRLEEISYNLWTESNTAFLAESVQTDGEEDAWFWDDSCLQPSSLTEVCEPSLPRYAEYLSFLHSPFASCDQTSESLYATTSTCLPSWHSHTQRNLTFISESSIDSSVRLCSDSWCSHGYYGSCESLDTTDMYETLDSAADGTSVTDKRHTADHAATRESDECELSDVSFERLLFSNDHDAREDKEDEIGSERLKSSNDEWVIVDDEIENNDWLIVSTSEFKRGPIEIHRNQDKRVSERMTVGSSAGETVLECAKCSMDLSDWSILSMRVSERSTTINGFKTPRSDAKCAIGNCTTENTLNSSNCCACDLTCCSFRKMFLDFRQSSRFSNNKVIL